MLVILTVVMAACGDAPQESAPTTEPPVQQQAEQQPVQQPATSNAPDADAYDELMELTGFNFSIALATINTHLSAIAQAQTVDGFQSWALESGTMFEGVQSIYNVLWDMMEQGLVPAIHEDEHLFIAQAIGNIIDEIMIFENVIIESLPYGVDEHFLAELDAFTNSLNSNAQALISALE